LWHERDPALRKIYQLSIRRSWLVERPEHSPLFNFIYAAALQAEHWKEATSRPTQSFVAPADYDLSACLEWFQDVPSDLIKWTIINSNRRDLGRFFLNRHGQLCSTRILPVSERPIMRWNGDPYELDGGSQGLVRDDGSFILLPYWMGRYHRFLSE